MTRKHGQLSANDANSNLQVDGSHVRTLKWYDLTAYGIAATVGSGIFVVCGEIALKVTGPSVVWSTVIAGLLALLTGICYLEFAGAFPVSGSGYSYCYAVLGEFVAWFMGWNLTLEYAFSASFIAEKWVIGLVNFLKANCKLTIPEYLYNFKLETLSKLLFGPDNVIRINILAALLIILVGAVVSRGVSMGARITNCITALNISIIALIIIVGSFYVQPSNWTAEGFFKDNDRTVIFAGAGQMFFSYIGFDTISSMAGEAVNPTRDLPIAVCLTISVATALYIAVGLVLTGMVVYTNLDKDAALADAFFKVVSPKMALVVSIGALLCTLATTFTCMIGQPKIFQAISKDGLLPRRIFNRTDARGTPVRGVFATTLLAATLVLFLNVDQFLINAISLGILFGMAIVCLSLIVARVQKHEAVRTTGIVAVSLFVIGCFLASLAQKTNSSFAYWLMAASGIGLMIIPLIYLIYIFYTLGDRIGALSATFACPLMPFLPCIAAFTNIYVACSIEDLQLPMIMFAIWTVIGIVIYFSYGLRHSTAAQIEASPETPKMQ